ncbi:hypothetical protein HDU98_008311 [Podochytrium sp. JEL0797]|nr:hypothetical protein HDU98_008311 [Podochytrium sp. JEL0797]
MFSHRMNFAYQADWCDSGVLAAKQRLAASGRLSWVARVRTFAQPDIPNAELRRVETSVHSDTQDSVARTVNVGGFNTQNLLQQQQQQCSDDLECSTGGYNHPFLASHALLNAAASRFQRCDHPLLDRAFPLAGAATNRVQSVKSNIVDELVQDRQRDEIQARLIKQLIRKSSTNRNNNHHADHIIFDLASGRPHLPHPEQKAIAARENFIKDQFAIQGVQRVTAPYANKKIITDEYITSVLETLAQAQQVGYGSRVTPGGIQYSPAQARQAWF